ncbi:MAG: heme-copper oxidase subunit III [Bacteroidia bacterium]|nr:heme-copper oxidase subunit III [Bacteroidia bacterium]
MDIAIQGASGKKIPNALLGMILFLTVEVMLFAGFISAYTVNRATAAVWPPYSQPRLPIEITFVNTLVLLASGITAFLFARQYKRSAKMTLLYVTILLGIIFLSIQGSEWAKLISYGLTTSSSLYGAFFYTIIGAHAVHAVAGLVILLYLLNKLQRSSDLQDKQETIVVCNLYWYFVVGIWPVLYVLVYLL